jgi:hypothetical protein
MEFILHIEDGKITNPKVAAKAWDELKDGSYWVKIVTKKQRTLNQNAYYWTSVLDIVLTGLQDIGYREVKTKDEVHEICKSLFLKTKIVNQETGEVIETVGSTTELTTTEFNEYIDRIAQWAAEYLACEILPPNTQTQINL